MPQGGGIHNYLEDVLGILKSGQERRAGEFERGEKFKRQKEEFDAELQLKKDQLTQYTNAQKALDAMRKAQVAKDVFEIQSNISDMLQQGKVVPGVTSQPAEVTGGTGGAQFSPIGGISDPRTISIRHQMQMPEGLGGGALDIVQKTPRLFAEEQAKNAEIAAKASPTYLTNQAVNQRIVDEAAKQRTFESGESALDRQSREAVARINNPTFTGMFDPVQVVSKIRSGQMSTEAFNADKSIPESVKMQVGAMMNDPKNPTVGLTEKQLKFKSDMQRFLINTVPLAKQITDKSIPTKLKFMAGIGGVIKEQTDPEAASLENRIKAEADAFARGARGVVGTQTEGDLSRTLGALTSIKNPKETNQETFNSLVGGLYNSFKSEYGHLPKPQYDELVKEMGFDKIPVYMKGGPLEQPPRPIPQGPGLSTSPIQALPPGQNVQSPVPQAGMPSMNPLDQSQSTAQRMFGQKSAISGLVTPGNIDLHKRPVVKNPDGSISTVRSVSFQDDDGLDVLVPTVSDDGRNLTDEQAWSMYKNTGNHLGKFKTPADATRYAEQLHKDQEREYVKPSGSRVNLPTGPIIEAPSTHSGPQASMAKPRTMQNLIDEMTDLTIQMEGTMKKDSIGARNNNPGNMRNPPGGKLEGSTGSKDGFAVFPTWEAGKKALNRQIERNIDRNLTVSEHVKGKKDVYSGYSETDQDAYTKHLATGLGVDANTKFKDLIKPAGGQSTQAGQLASAKVKIKIPGGRVTEVDRNDEIFQYLINQGAEIVQ